MIILMNQLWDIHSFTGIIFIVSAALLALLLCFLLFTVVSYYCEKNNNEKEQFRMIEKVIAENQANDDLAWQVKTNTYDAEVGGNQNTKAKVDIEDNTQAEEDFEPEIYIETQTPSTLC